MTLFRLRRRLLEWPATRTRPPFCVRQRPDEWVRSCSNGSVGDPDEIHMYLGGILGTNLVIGLIVYFVRRI